MGIGTAVDTAFLKDRWRGTVVEAVGNTPLIRLGSVFAKLEFLNPSGSVKARVAAYVVARAEQEGLLRPGDTIVEASSGNTGNALSMVAAVAGYRMLVIMPSGLSQERDAISRAFGAEIVTAGTFHVNDALAQAREWGALPGYFCPQQFDSEWNVEENREWLGSEIVSQLPVNSVPDALIVGVGTGGTLIGVGQALRDAFPSVRLIAVEPDESCTLLCNEIGCHVIEGIADGFVPGIVVRHRDLIDDVIPVSGSEAIAEMRRLASEHGLFVGPSSGAHIAAARRFIDAHPRNRCVVTLLCDEGEKYISQHFQPAAPPALTGVGH